MIQSLTLGAVSFLNAEPLVWPLLSGVIEHSHKIVRAVPRDIVKMLETREIDCALSPIAAILDNPALIPLPDVAIATRGEVASVLLFHNDPFGELETILLDPQSRTSNLLVKILRFNASNNPCKFIMPTDGNSDDISNLPALTGRLVIGDKALKYSSDTTQNADFSDLGTLWKELTNHPFTFARWYAQTGDIAGAVAPLIRQARDWSVLNLNKMIEPLSERYGFITDVVDRYLRINITYNFGPREQAGESEFFKLLRELPGKEKST